MHRWLCCHVQGCEIHGARCYIKWGCTWWIVEFHYICHVHWECWRCWHNWVSLCIWGGEGWEVSALKPTGLQKQLPELRNRRSLGVAGQWEWRRRIPNTFLEWQNLGLLVMHQCKLSGWHPSGPILQCQACRCYVKSWSCLQANWNVVSLYDWDKLVLGWSVYQRSSHMQIEEWDEPGGMHLDHNWSNPESSAILQWGIILIVRYQWMTGLQWWVHCVRHLTLRWSSSWGWQVGQWSRVSGQRAVSFWHAGDQANCREGEGWPVFEDTKSRTVHSIWGQVPSRTTKHHP